MATSISTYAGKLFMQEVFGTGPYFGHYKVGHALDADMAWEAATWVELLKPWPHKVLASDDATRAAHFAIDVLNYSDASAEAIEAAAFVMTLSDTMPGWPAAVHAERRAAVKRDALEGRLVGGKERHWPDAQIHGRRSEVSRCQ
ncbi:MAG: hypothetical protein EOP39_04070 [Rubrivivax sp.]|nr:MAG: hypothetical protein EOP39_04070 [Rubrivivax sp.]